MIRVTMGQLCKGAGWPVVGNVKADRARYRTAVRRWLAMLEAMGWVESWEPLLRPDGVGRCVEIRTSGELYQLSYLAERHAAYSRRRVRSVCPHGPLPWRVSSPPLPL